MSERENIQFLSPDLRKPLEETVSKYVNREWRVSRARDLSDLACHPAAILADGSFEVFAKFSEHAHAAQQFATEKTSLEFLANRAGVQIPTPIGIIPVESGTLFIMEALTAIERGSIQWQQISKSLARIHAVKSDYFGFHSNNYFGPLDQDNSPANDWATFYGEYRLKPRLKMAVDSGNLPSPLASQVESVVRRLPGLCGPEVPPTLLHGDAQQNNFISTREGAYVIDPAIHFGNPELDLAFIDYFQPVPQAVFDAYREEISIDPGFDERRDLWRISGYLAAVAVEGSPYLGMLADALRKYL